MYILSVDFGTSSVKASILDENLDTVASTKIEYQFNVLSGDRIELDPSDVFEAFIQCTNKLSTYMQNVGILTYDIFSPSVMFMEENGNSLYPIITHLDRRSLKQTQEILEIIGEDEFYKITGVLPFAGGVSITSILWIKENLPEVYEKTYKIGHFNTYFHKKTTGVWAIDPVNASMMGLYDTIKDTGWSESICKAFDIHKDKLPDIVQAGTILGELNKEVSDLTGLRQGIPVVLGSNDAASAQVGACNENSGDVLNISGSSEILTIITDKPVLNKNYYIRRAVTPGKWQIFAITTGGFAIEWFRKEFCRDMDKNEFYDKYLPDLVNSRSKKTEITFLPYLTGDRHSLEKKRGGFLGLTLGTTRDDMLTSILFGMHEPIVKVFELAGEFLKLNRTIKITGGLINNQDILRLKKNIFPGFDFKTINNCPIIGNARLALRSKVAKNL